MKITATLCDSDGFWDAAIDSARGLVARIKHQTEAERSAFIRSQSEDFMDQLGPWVDNHEQITIEFDLDKQTATVVKRQQ